SKGVRQTEIPDVYNKSVDDAIKRLVSEGFDANKITTVANKSNDSTKPDNVVVKTSPDIGASVPADSEITITFNPPKEKISVPNVIGMKIEEAKQIFGEDFNLKSIEVDSDQPVGIIVSQNPSDQAFKYSTIEVSVSKGPKEPTSQSAEKTINIKINLPTTDNEITLKAYLDGTLMTNGTITCIPSDKKVWNLSVKSTNSTKSQIKIRIDSFTYMVIDVDFSAGNYKIKETNQYNPNPSTSSDNSTNTITSSPIED
ncbi:MAG: PASTA domain-containing protein, partial [Oscillospiraceae bacterium]